MAQEDLDAFFLIVNAAIIFLMQCGFAFLECGAVRSKNATNILLKNILDSFLGFMIYWIIGYALAFGEGNAFAGDEYWCLAYLPDNLYANFFFHYVFAATAATIVSGAVAERCELIAYFVYSLIITGVIYPIVTHWAWHGNGWLYAGLEFEHEGETLTAAYMDFAGSGVVHLTGGTCALIGAAILGPRIGRFNDKGQARVLSGHSVPLAALGGFILFLGFFFFNGGSQAAIGDGDGNVVALAVVNTIVSGSFAGVTTMLTRRVGEVIAGRKPHWSLLNTINGGLTGMVAICAGCNVMYSWGAAVTGLVAGFVYVAFSSMVVAMKVDDPLDAVAVHGGGGIWGLIAAPLFAKDVGIVFAGDVPSAYNLAWNLVGMVAIMAWSGVISLIMFGTLRALRILRVSAEIEKKGMDVIKHGEPAYPYASYGDGWEEGSYGWRTPGGVTPEGSDDEDDDNGVRRRRITKKPYVIANPAAPMVMTPQGPKQATSIQPVAVSPGYIPANDQYYVAQTAAPPYAVYNAYELEQARRISQGLQHAATRM